MKKQGLQFTAHPFLVEADYAMKAIREIADSAVLTEAGLTKEQLEEILSLQGVWEEAMGKYVEACTHDVLNTQVKL